jgi:hypothetical protein
MAEQVQCPNCGGFRVYVSPRYSGPERIPNPEYKERSPDPGWLAIFQAFGVLALVVLPIIGILLIWSIGLIILIIWLVLLLIMMITVDGSSSKGPEPTIENPNRHITSYNNSCNLCGYAWTWRPGTPRLPVQHRPDLIQRGNALLEEQERLAEQERRRRTREEAELRMPPPPPPRDD